MPPEPVACGWIDDAAGDGCTPGEVAAALAFDVGDDAAGTTPVDAGWTAEEVFGGETDAVAAGKGSVAITAGVVTFDSGVARLGFATFSSG